MKFIEKFLEKSLMHKFMQCDPNCVGHFVFFDSGDPFLPRLAFFALRTIEAGEELTFDYAMQQDVSSKSRKIFVRSSNFCHSFVYRSNFIRDWIQIMENKIFKIVFSHEICWWDPVGGRERNPVQVYVEKMLEIFGDAEIIKMLLNW